MRMVIVIRPEDSDLIEWLGGVQSGKRSMVIKAILRYAIEHNLAEHIPLMVLTPSRGESPDRKRLTRLVETGTPTAAARQSGQSGDSGQPDDRGTVKPPAAAPEGAGLPQTLPATSRPGNTADQPAGAPTTDNRGTPRWKRDKSLWRGPYLEIGDTLSTDIWERLSNEDRDQFILAHVPEEISEEMAMAALKSLSPKARDINELTDLYKILSSAGMI